MNARTLLIVAALASLAACSKKDEPVTATPALPQAMPATAAAPAPASAGGKGKVVQLLQAAGYTYAEVETSGGQKLWMAGGPLQVKEGDVIQWGKHAVMQNFTAKSLGRTFETILFVDSWGPEGGSLAQVAPHGAKPAAIDPAMLAPAANKPLVAGEGNSGQVKNVAQAGEYTYLEIVQGKNTVWVAAPASQVKAGDKVAWEGDMVMENFQSKSLGRQFERITFATRVETLK